jgi:hypothetical protein
VDNALTKESSSDLKTRGEISLLGDAPRVKREADKDDMDSRKSSALLYSRAELQRPTRILKHILKIPKCRAAPAAVGPKGLLHSITVTAPHTGIESPNQSGRESITYFSGPSSDLDQPILSAVAVAPTRCVLISPHIPVCNTLPPKDPHFGSVLQPLLSVEFRLFRGDSTSCSIRR